MAAVSAHVAVAANEAAPAPRDLKVVLAAPPPLEARSLGMMFPGSERAAPPGAAVDALLRSYDRVAVNPAHPEVILAWSRTGAAITTDDGTSWTRTDLPGTDGTELPVGTVASDGAGLLSLGLQGWLRLGKGGVQQVLPPSGGVVSAWASDERWTFALVKEPDELQRTLYSHDAGATWRRGPDAPRGAEAVTPLTDGRAAVSYAWDTSCGGGDEGVVTLRSGEGTWSRLEQHRLGTLGPDLHVLGVGCDEHRTDAVCSWPPGDDAKPSVGPDASIRPGESPWFASGRRASFVGGGGAVRRVRDGVFTEVEVAAPQGLHDVVVDGKERLVGIVNGHVVRWTAPAIGNRGDWQVHLP